MENNKKKAFITGITGQDGSYLADLLLSKNYEIHGLVRRASSFNRKRIEHIYKDAQSATNLFLHYGDLTDSSNLARLIEKINPDEIYNLGAQSHVGISFDVPVYTAQTVAISTLRLLEAIRETRVKTKFYQASSSEMFGKVRETPQNEKTPFYPRSPYGISKVFAYWAGINYREAYDMFICNGILFNHESPRRGENFVTRKITIGIADILSGKKDKLYLGNLEARRDWGYALDFVEAMWLMMQQEKGDDYIIATGETHSIREFLDEAFMLAGIDNWEKYIEIDPRYYRPTEVDALTGDPSKAKQKLGWEPKVKFKDLVKIMLEADCKRAGINLSNNSNNYLISNFNTQGNLNKKAGDKRIGVGCADIDNNSKNYVADVLNNERLSYGPYSEKFERMFAQAHNINFAILVNSGTSALRLAVACLKETEDWQHGDEIICPAVTFIASSNVIIMNGLKPIFIDVCSKTYNIDPNKIEEKITDKTRAIMAVHLFGQPAEMSPIMEIAKKYSLKVIEDSCETMFAAYKGRSVGSFGDVSCFSTYMAHLLTTGVGGMACTNNKLYAEKIKSLANHGRDGIYLNIDDDKKIDKQGLFNVVSKRFSFVNLGYSFRLTEMEAALGVAQIEKKDEILRKRKQNAHYLIDGLKQLEEYLQLPWWPHYKDHAFMMFPIVIKPNVPFNKNDLVMFLEENNVETRDMLPLINQPIYKKIFGEIEGQYPIARWINNNGFYIGCHQYIERDELDYIVEKFHEFFEAKNKR